MSNDSRFEELKKMRLRLRLVIFGFILAMAAAGFTLLLLVEMESTIADSIWKIILCVLALMTAGSIGNAGIRAMRQRISSLTEQHQQEGRMR